MAETSLSGRHALVTGGGRGIGLACAEALSRAGADITILGRDEEALDAAVAAGAASRRVRADVTDEPQVRAALEAAAQEAGPIDILVNNAGGAETAPFLKTDHAMVERMLSLNLASAFTLCRLVLPAMLERKSGRIINIASTAGLKGYAYVSAYCAAKHGLIGLTRALALETAKSGVTVNAVCPGFTETDLIAGSIRTIMDKTGRDEASARAELAKANPQGRLVRPEEVAAAVAYLASDLAAAVNGAILPVSGGEA